MLSTCFFFFHDTATTEIYTLSLHDALPIFVVPTKNDVTLTYGVTPVDWLGRLATLLGIAGLVLDRKSTRLNSSHTVISYAVFCLKKKNKSCTDIHRSGDSA